MKEFALDSASLKHFNFHSGSVRLHAVEAGPTDGRVVVLLHGFSEFWYGWRNQILPLSAAGFRVVVPDGRGYNLSDKPTHIRDYAISHLVSDVLALCEYLACGDICLVGHDWGAAVAWAFAAQHPERVNRLAILNAPHPAIMPDFLLTHPRQMLRSWYMFFFQLPRLPEMLLAARNCAVGVNSLTNTSRPGTFSNSDLNRYREAWAQPGALTGMINWYRAMFRNRPASRIGDIEIPVLILWGKLDAFLVPELAELSLSRCRDAKLVWFEDATHWVQHEEADRVNDNLLRFSLKKTNRRLQAWRPALCSSASRFGPSGAIRVRRHETTCKGCW